MDIDRIVLLLIAVLGTGVFSSVVNYYLYKNKRKVEIESTAIATYDKITKGMREQVEFLQEQFHRQSEEIKAVRIVNLKQSEQIASLQEQLRDYTAKELEQLKQITMLMAEIEKLKRELLKKEDYIGNILLKIKNIEEKNGTKKTKGSSEGDC